MQNCVSRLVQTGAIGNCSGLFRIPGRYRVSMHQLQAVFFIEPLVRGWIRYFYSAHLAHDLSEAHNGSHVHSSWCCSSFLYEAVAVWRSKLALFAGC